MTEKQDMAGSTGWAIHSRTLVAALALTLCASARAVGLGEIAVHSSLGQALRASIALIGAADDDALRSCVRARVQTLDGAALGTATVSTAREGHAVRLHVNGSVKLNEPALTLVVELSCSGKSQREYPILLDPVEWPAALASAPARAGSGIVRAPVATVQAEGGTPPANATRKPFVRPAGAMSGTPKARPAPNVSAAASAPARTAQPKPAQASVAASAPKPAAAGPMRNVLRLTPDDASASVSKNPGAADSGTLSLAETERRLREVQVKLAALDGGAAPAAASATGSLSVDLDRTEQKMKEVRARILALQIETKNVSAKEPKLVPTVKPKPAASPVAAPVAPPPSPDSSLVMWLGALLAGCIAIIGALVWRMRQMNRYRSHLDSF